MSYAMFFAVGCGGALGAMGRYLIGIGLGRLLGPTFPWGTLTVNILGSLLMGMMVTAFALRYSVTEEMRAFLMVGLLGGLTTYSSFALDFATLLERGSYLPLFSYMAGTLLCGLGGIFLGMYVMRTFYG